MSMIVCGFTWLLRCKEADTRGCCASGRRAEVVGIPSVLRLSLVEDVEGHQMVQSVSLHSFSSELP